MTRRKIFQIEHIPSLLWGKDSEKVIIAVHGNMSHKADTPIEILADSAAEKGYQVLSFDLPQHGDRTEESTLCKVQNCVEELDIIMQYAKRNWNQISLFANSLGAYFSLLAYRGKKIEKAWFLSPVVDMCRMIENMMNWFQITEERLKCEQTISTPAGQDLYWDYYCYVKEHPICDWKVPTFILYGEKDEMCEKDTILKFTNDFSCNLEIVEDAEHHFHTSSQLKMLNVWIKKNL